MLDNLISCRPKKLYGIFSMLIIGATTTILFLNQYRPALKKSVKIGVIGDLLFHRENQIQAFSQRSYKSIWNSIQGHFGNFDILYANYEGLSANVISLPNGSCAEVAAQAELEYGPVFRSWEIAGKHSKLNIFNYHSMLARDLKASGFDIVSIANNHILDLCEIGLMKTMDNLIDARLPFIGGKHHIDHGWFEIIWVGVHKIAWIACTETMNQKYPTESVLYCDNPEFLNLVSSLSEWYTVVACVHGGSANSYGPTRSFQEIVFNTLKNGAVLVLGNHPHVSQPVEVFRVNNRRTAVLWSAGNFISHQGFGIKDDRNISYNKPDLRKRSSGILNFQLKPYGGGLQFDCFDYVPTCVECTEVNGVDEYFVRHVENADCESEGRWLENVWGKWGECQSPEENINLESRWGSMMDIHEPPTPKLLGEGKCLRDLNVFNYNTRIFE